MSCFLWEVRMGKKYMDFIELDDRLYSSSGALLSPLPRLHPHLWSGISMTSHLGHFHFQNNLIFFYKVKHTPNMQFSNTTPRYLFKWNKDRFTQNPVYKYLFVQYVALFIFTPKWKQHRYLSHGKSISKMWYGHKWNVLSHVWLFATPWTVAHQAPLSMKFSRQEYWSGLPFSSPGDIPDPGDQTRQWKRLNSWYTHHGQTSNALWEVKEASVYLHDILEKARLRVRKQISAF